MVSKTHRNKKPIRTAAEILADPDESIIPESECLTLLNVSHATWWRGRKEGRYPKEIKVGPNSNRFRLGCVRKVMRGGVK